MTARPGLATGLAALALCACSGATGTVTVELATAPDSRVLDGVTRLRVTLTTPRMVVEAARSGSGFDLSLEVDASSDNGAIIVEGLDAGGAVIAYGQTPEFTVGAITARVVVYMAAPRSIALSPRSLSDALTEVSSASLGFGAVITGGRTGAGALATGLAIYNAYDHSLVDGLPLPEARSGLAVATNAFGAVYLFGGIGPSGAASGTLWRFDTNAGPRGGYVTVSNNADVARSREAMVSVGSDRFLITGAPALMLERGTLSQRTDVGALPPVAAPLTLPDGQAAALFAGDPLLLFRAGEFTSLAASSATDAALAALPDGRGLVIGGLDPEPQHDALLVDGETGQITVVAGVLATARSSPSVAATRRYVIVAGGTDADGAPVATAEVLDARTLAPIVTLPVVARSGAFAIALSNDQVLIGGGSPASAQLELFTPEPPELP
jgi:hypothetical protein